MSDTTYKDDTVRTNTRDLLGTLKEELATIDSAENRISFVDQKIKGQKKFSTSLGLEDQAVLHVIWAGQSNIDVFFLDTGRHFTETFEVLHRSIEKYNLKIETVVSNSTETQNLINQDGVLGFRSSIDKRKECCRVRKIAPLQRTLSDASVWITGLRQNQSTGRSQISCIEWDQDLSIIKFNPIFDWPDNQLLDYVRTNSIPTNSLHERGFPSIGCSTCTRAVTSNEHPRAGRWWWEQDGRRECGLHSRMIDRKVSEAAGQ